jgi:two-component system, NtrC family, nitrogen regulation sensor histidine kinase NtrY
MHSLRNRLIAAFLIATILPLAATIAITTSLLESSLGYATTEELDRISRTLEDTVRQFYQREREALRQDAAMGRLAPTTYATADTAAWPDEIRAFWDSAEPERFGVTGPDGDRLEYLRRASGGVDVYTRDLAGIHLQELSTKLRSAREVVGSIETRDLRRGFTLTLLLLVAIVWVISLAPLLFMAHRISKPIRQLTAGLTGFAQGDWDRRVESSRGDEVGRAVDAFNHMAEQLRRSRERLVYLTQMSSWQSLARKTAHELKNSLTPIRLTVEEILARQPSTLAPSHSRTVAPSPEADRAFMQEAAQIVISEIETLERRVRAFSEFAREPPVNPEAFDLNALVTERVSLLKPAHPNTTYRFKLDVRGPRGHAGADLVKGILTNLLENAADAAGPHGSIVAITRAQGDQVVVEVHDSGPGIGADASRTLFEPTITFKKHGMGLGLSIARKNALVLGGDITLVNGELGGAAFRVVLPAAQDSPTNRSVRLDPDRGLPPSREAAADQQA